MENTEVRSSQQPTDNGSTLIELSGEDDRPLEQRLWNISQASEDGHIRGYIDKCELTDDDTVRIYVQLPNNETHTQIFPMPRIDSPKYAFVRLVEDCGYSLSSVGQLADDDSTSGTRVWCKPVDTSEHLADSGGGDEEGDSDRDRSSDWQLVLPGYTPPFRERLHARLKILNSWKIVTTLAVGGGFLLLPLLFPVILLRLLNDDSSDMVMTLILGALALLAWSSGMWLLYVAVLAPAVDISAII